MRKAQKKQIEELTALLADAHQEIIYAIKNKDTGLAMDLLARCQQCAVWAGTMLSALEGENHPTYACLEAYCDTLYQIYDNLEQDCLSGDAGSLLAEKCNELNDSVKNDISVRKEVVFCPYKASMWDSLESVWKAAAEDSECDAYVVPIPYYDKNPDGGFREFHYEGDLYPDYVPVTDYRTYNFAERRPDMVFIHNPYDEYNYVTSVHPEFYASKLKEYTDKLVYIPYFILEELRLEQVYANAGIEEKMNSFCLQPGVLNADKVIVQSEEMKKIYVELLVKNYGEHTRTIWEEKILGLGSPKLDKIHSVTEDDFEIPEKWKPILYKEDGSRRKTILYNTSVTALLQHEEKMLQKMQEVFRIFYENRDEMALLWRPHPLIQATIESMRPELWEKYQKLVEAYKEAGWGIYDDSAELERAIGLSDAYYGDGSSVVQLCQEKGMPVMMQEVEE